MESVSLNQPIPFRQKIIVGLPLIAIGLLGFKESVFVGLACIILGLIVFSLNKSLIITKTFKCYYEIKSFSFSLFKIKRKLFFPDYVSLFFQSFIQPNNVGFSPKVLGDSRFKLYTIKFFKDHKNVIIFTSSNKNEAINLAVDLTKMLDVELHNALE